MGRFLLAFAIVVSAVLLVSIGGVRAQLSFADIPAASDVTSSRAGLDQRIARVLAYWSAQQRRPFPKRTDDRAFARIALAKLRAGREVPELNRVLLATSARPFALYGTNISVLPGVCARGGDYDFLAQELVRLAHEGALWPQTVRKIAWQLLPEAGARHHESFRLGMCGRHRESENHILMTESSRYLTNQLRESAPGHANRANGFDDWMLRHLSRFLRGHFEEYNARPYQGYTVEALSNLHSFADSEPVALGAQLVLDYLSAVFAVQSNGLRRHGPFRRQARHANTPITHDHDTETARFALLAGNYQYLPGGKVPYGEHFMLSAAVGRYRVPDSILDLMVRKDRGPYYQRFHHDGVELYASSPSFLVSAGGVFVRHFKFGSAEQHGWARATTVIPSRDPGSDTRAWLRVLGTHAPELRNNSCVAPNFACGVNLEIPASIPASCRLRDGAFEFLDFSARRCPLQLGFYVAARIAPCDSGRCGDQAKNFGAFELREASDMPFAAFRERVLRNNRGRSLHSDGLSHYVSSDGRHFVFEVFAERSLWPIVSIDGHVQSRSFQRWPLAEGDIVHASGDGLIRIDNPWQSERLTLDARDPLRPTRTLETLPATDPRVARSGP